MKTTKLVYRYAYTPYKPENYSLCELIESGKDIDEPFKSILLMIYNYIQKPVNDKDGVYLIGNFTNDVDDIDDFYKYIAYQVKVEGKSYSVKIGIDSKSPYEMKAVIKSFKI